MSTFDPLVLTDVDIRNRLNMKSPKSCESPTDSKSKIDEGDEELCSIAQSTFRVSPTAWSTEQLFVADTPSTVDVARHMTRSQFGETAVQPVPGTLTVDGVLTADAVGPVGLWEQPMSGRAGSR